MHVFFLIFLLYITVVKSDNETKYIDLLPEKEKEEFLDTIARRILEEVENKGDRLNKSGEVSDEQLNKQDEFVRKILKEESENLRKQANDTDANLGDTNNTKYSPPALREDENKFQQYVDLTLRTHNNRSKRSNRRVFTGYTTDDDNNTVVNKSGAESELDVQVRNFKRRSADDISEIIKLNKDDLTTLPNIQTTEEIIAKIQNDREENNITDILRRIYENNDNFTDITTNETPVDKDKDLTTVKADSSDITIDFNNNSPETQFTTVDYSDNTFATDVTSTDLIPYEVIQKTFNPLANTSFEDARVETEHKVVSNKLRQFRYDFSSSNETSVLRSSSITENENTKEIFNTSTQHPEKINEDAMSDNHVSFVNETTTESHINDSRVINIDVITISPVDNKMLNDKRFKSSVTEQTTSKIEALTPSTSIHTELKSEVSTDSTNMPEDSITISQNKEKEVYIHTYFTTDPNLKLTVPNNITKTNKNLLNGVMKALREDLIINGKKYEDGSNTKPPLQEYRVFEIPSDAIPFVKKDVPKKKPSQKFKTLPKLGKPQPKLLELKTKPKNIEIKAVEPEIKLTEEPYHVPIYNYLPKNAFYNPNNAFGPNYNKDSDDEGKNNGDHIYPSPKPVLTDDEGTNNTDTINQPMEVPIYIYAPEYAFYNPNNNNGPNEKDTPIIKGNKIDISSEKDYSEESEEREERSIKERDEMEWQYYNDPAKSKPKNVKVYEIKQNLENENLTLINLTKFVKDLVIQAKKNGTPLHSGKQVKHKMAQNILTNDLDWYSKKPRALLRCLYKKKCGQKHDDDDETKDKSKEDGNISESELEFDTTMSKVRHMMLVNGHFMLVNNKVNYSRLDDYFASAERVEDKKDHKKHHKNVNDKKPTDADDNKNSQSSDDEDDYKEPTGKKERRAKKILRELLKRNDLLNKENNPNFDIAADYYFGKPERDRKDRKPRDLDTHKIAIIINRNQQSTERVNKLLRSKHKPPKKPDKFYEYLLIKDLAEELPDADIENLYWQLEILEKINLRMLKRNNSQELDAFIEVLGDMIKENNKGLDKYDWLGTAVDLQSAIKKMVDMTERVQNEESIHPSDLELLKYLIWQHSYAKEELNEVALPEELRGIKLHTGKKNRGKIITEKGLLPKAWIHRIRPKPIPDEELQDFQNFLTLLQNSLHDLHTALKYIATVTKYKHQSWFENLKQIHVEISRKRLLELIIHLSTTRLFGLIELSAKNGLEDNFNKYLKKNGKEVEMTKEEFVFVLKLLEEFKKLE